MPSMQNAAPGSKSMKFQDGLNPFAPFLSRPVSFFNLIADHRVYTIFSQFFLN